MVDYQNKERVGKILAIALDMHQAKELRIQAVRLLKVMGAIDELWTVVQNVKCPFTRQSAIDSIPALDVNNAPDNNQVAAPQKPENEVSIPHEPAKMDMTDLQKKILSYLFALWDKDGIEGVSLNTICVKTETQAQTALPALMNLTNLKFVKKMLEDKRGWSRELFGITDEGIRYAKLHSLSA